MTKWLAIQLGVILLTCASGASAWADGLCLDNNGGRTVKAGTTYSDYQGTWVCSPDQPGATVGGWLLISGRVASAPTLSATLPAPTTTVSDISLGEPGAGHERGLAIVLSLASLVAIAGLASAMLFLKRVRGQCLTGSILVDKERLDAGD